MRPQTHRVGPAGAWRPGQGFPEYERPRTLAPDDDPEFLRSRRADEELFSRWEADLRRREEELRRRETRTDRPDSQCFGEASGSAERDRRIRGSAVVRGGRGNFGVVTGKKTDLLPVTTLYGGGLFFVGESAGEVFGGRVVTRRSPRTGASRGRARRW